MSEKIPIIFGFLLTYSYLCGMNDAITLYHGSNVAVERPQILVSGFYKDFGYGFYCTNIEKQAISAYIVSLLNLDMRSCSYLSFISSLRKES